MLSTSQLPAGAWATASCDTDIAGGTASIFCDRPVGAVSLPFSGTAFTANGRVSEIDLGSSALQGNLPAGLTQLGGEIPLELAQLEQLTELQLGSNRLSGGIPRELGQMEKLEDPSLWGNELSGPIPPELTGLKRLRNLDLSLNELTGAIPSAFGELTNLESLDLSFNRLREGLPVAIAAAPALAGLDVSFNPMRGTIDWAFRKRINEDGLLLGVAGAQITGYGPPERDVHEAAEKIGCDGYMGRDREGMRTPSQDSAFKQEHSSLH